MTELIQYKSEAERNLHAAFAYAESGHFAQAIDCAWKAEANTALFAKELERLRVTEDATRREASK